jgi:hypothetical protein
MYLMSSRTLPYWPTTSASSLSSFCSGVSSRANRIQFCPKRCESGEAAGACRIFESLSETAGSHLDTAVAIGDIELKPNIAIQGGLPCSSHFPTTPGGTPTGWPSSSGSEIGEYRGLVRVGCRVFQRILSQNPTPERCIGGYYLHRTRLELIAERKVRRRQLTDDGNIEITGRDLRDAVNPVDDERMAR